MFGESILHQSFQLLLELKVVLRNLLDQIHRTFASLGIGFASVSLKIESLLFLDLFLLLLFLQLVDSSLDGVAVVVVQQMSAHHDQFFCPLLSSDLCFDLLLLLKLH